MVTEMILCTNKSFNYQLIMIIYHFNKLWIRKLYF